MLKELFAQYSSYSIIRYFGGLLFCLTFLPLSTEAQTYIPLGDNTTTDVEEVRNTRLLGRLRGIVADVPAVSGNTTPTCANPPDVNSLPPNFTYNGEMMSGSEAVNAGVLANSGSVSLNRMYFVSDYVRFVPCTATDGRNTILYGQAVRTILTLSDASMKAGLTLPVIAADATINRKSHSIRVEVLGLSNAQFNSLIANLANKEFNVENYGQYLGITGQIINLALE